MAIENTRFEIYLRFVWIQTQTQSYYRKIMSRSV